MNEGRVKAPDYRLRIAASLLVEQQHAGTNYRQKRTI